MQKTRENAACQKLTDREQLIEKQLAVLKMKDIKILLCSTKLEIRRICVSTYLIVTLRRDRQIESTDRKTRENAAC